MPEHTKEWRQLAHAFYALAHGDAKLFHALPQALKDTEVGRLCQQIAENRDSDLIDKAGRMLTGGSRDWYTYIGRA